jgi:O-methyltransferase involved in polyketide biosynthesis
MNNSKISITAELVSIIRAENNQRNMFFVSNKGRKLYDIAKKILSEKKIKEIFNWRIRLSDDFDKKVSTNNYDQIIELAAGYSLRGFDLCLKNKNIIYIDSDFEDVIYKKKKILNNICEKEDIDFPNNYFLVGVDALEDNIFSKVSAMISKDKKTIIMTEGLTSYFSKNEFGKFIDNIKEFLSNLTNGEFFSHESISQPMKGITYHLLRKILVSFLTKTKGRCAFKTSKEFEDYMKSKNISKFNIFLDKHGHLLYSIYS